MPSRALLSYPPMLRRAPLFAVFLLAYFLSYFFRSTNAVIAEDLTRELSLTAGQLGLMTSLFFLIFAAVQLPLGAALDRFGARFVTPALMLAGVLGSVLFAVASSFEMLALGRALMGLGMAGVLMGSLKAFSQTFSAERFTVVASVFVGLGSLGALAAATPLAWLNAEIGWRAVFWGGAGVILLSAAALAVFGGTSPPPAATSERSESGFGPVFRSPIFWRIALANLALAGSMFGYQALWAGPFLSDAHGLDELAVGNVLLWMALGVTTGYLAVGWLADRFGVVPILALGTGAVALVQFVLAAVPGNTSATLLGPLFAIFGFFGAHNVLAFANARAVFPLAMTGRAVTALNIFGIGGSALVQWGLGILIGTFALAASGDHPIIAYRTLFVVTGGLCVIAVIGYWPMLKKRNIGIIP